MPAYWSKFLSLVSRNGIYVEVAIWLLVACVVWYIYYRIYKYLNKRLSKLKHAWPQVLLKSIRFPLVIYLWFLFATWLLQKVEKNFFVKPIFSHWSIVYKVSTVIMLFGIVMCFIHYMQKMLLERISEHAKFKTNKTAIVAVAQILRVMTMAFLVLMVMQVTGIPISALLTIGGISTLAIGFAAKDTLENYMGGAMIYLDRPFGEGDSIQLPKENIEGVVERIRWRLTKIRTHDKKLLYIPNKLFSNSIIINASLMTNRRIKKVFGVRYQDAGAIPGIIADIQAYLDGHDGIDQDISKVVSLDAANGNSLDILVMAFTKTTSMAPFRIIQQDLLMKILNIIEKYGAVSDFSTQSLEIPDPVKIKVLADNYDQDND